MGKKMLLGSVVLVLVSFAACKTAKKEPPRVAKVAIVSVTSSQLVPHRSRKGSLAGWSDGNRRAIADQALAAFSAELGKAGFEVVPAATVAALPVYQQNFAPKPLKAAGAVADAVNAAVAKNESMIYFSPSALHPVPWLDDAGQPETLTVNFSTLSLDKNKSLKTRMQELAAAAGADAALLIQGDYCADDGNLWVGKVGSGTGTAVITGAFGLYAVDPKGGEILKWNRITQSCAGEGRVGSDTATAMADGRLLYQDERIRKMFAEVASKAAPALAGRLRSATAR